jgi:hypothetical protein
LKNGSATGAECQRRMGIRESDLMLTTATQPDIPILKQAKAEYAKLK